MANNRERFNIYVIALDVDVMKNRKYREANRGYVEGKPCVCVGMTGRTPDERFQQHENGYKSSRYPRKYGKYLRRKLFEHLNPMTYEQACKKEVELAKQLRKKGYGVWQK